MCDKNTSILGMIPEADQCLCELIFMFIWIVIYHLCDIFSKPENIKIYMKWPWYFLNYMYDAFPISESKCVRKMHSILGVILEADQCLCEFIFIFIQIVVYHLCEFLYIIMIVQGSQPTWKSGKTCKNDFPFFQSGNLRKVPQIRENQGESCRTFSPRVHTTNPLDDCLALVAL